LHHKRSYLALIRRNQAQCQIGSWLLCVIDGKVIIGEVKSTPGEIGDGELGAPAAVAVDIRPDVVVVAAVKGDETQLARKVETLRTAVLASIEVRGICGSERNSGDELFFRSIRRSRGLFRRFRERSARWQLHSRVGFA
jgi:hypothetical protein